MNPNPELSEFVRLVKLMRAAQRSYFQTRNRNVLQESKDAERRVDLWLKERDEKKGPTLF
jgi:hypothetical protein